MKFRKNQKHRPLTCSTIYIGIIKTSCSCCLTNMQKDEQLLIIFKSAGKSATQTIGIFIAKDMRLFSVVKDRAFLKLVNRLESKCDIPSHADLQI